MKSIARFLAIVVFFMTSLEAVGQRKTYLGFEFGPKHEVSRIIGGGNSVNEYRENDGIVGGVILGQEIGEKLLLETGFYAYRYTARVSMDSYGSAGIRAYGASQIPFHVKVPFSLFGTRLRLTPAVGYSVVFKNDYGNDFISSGTSIGLYPDGDYVRVGTPTNFRKVFVLLDAGLSLEWEFKSTFIVYLSGNYFGGPQRVIESDLTSKTGSEPLEYGKLYSNGSYFSKILGVKFPISPIWQYKR
ncbi:hypothetical protein [uncultured Imperialibacter sp.]|mgnify:CR=1 FL=1|uniref:hypothetical protein n=1 Tax=uncultured Imperialibacter sp. TaxID=1672639 RepID=UPI0030DB1F42|tara:strand:+ start:40286 stop:41017 length:732 start_codon:yes stop_codon:yes gene_type:complete